MNRKRLSTHMSFGTRSRPGTSPRTCRRTLRSTTCSTKPTLPRAGRQASDQDYQEPLMLGLRSDSDRRSGPKAAKRSGSRRLQKVAILGAHKQRFAALGPLLRVKRDRGSRPWGRSYGAAPTAFSSSLRCRRQRGSPSQIHRRLLSMRGRWQCLPCPQVLPSASAAHSP